MQLDPQTLARKKKLQLELIMKESDYRKQIRRKADAEMAIKELKRKKSQLEMEILQKESEIKRILSEDVLYFAEIKKLKGELNRLQYG